MRLYSHGIFILSTCKTFDADYKAHVMFELQISGGEPAHREPVYQVEGKAACGVVPAR